MRVSWWLNCEEISPVASQSVGQFKIQAAATIVKVEPDGASAIVRWWDFNIHQFKAPACKMKTEIAA